MPQHNVLKEQGKGLFYLFYLLAPNYPGSSMGWRNVPFHRKALTDFPNKYYKADL